MPPVAMDLKRFIVQSVLMISACCPPKQALFKLVSADRVPLWTKTEGMQVNTAPVACAGEEAEAGDVDVGLQEAVDILNAATKGCGSYAKPILRHITTVADFAKREGVQVGRARAASSIFQCCATVADLN